MAQADIIMPIGRTDQLPKVRTIGISDLWEALAKGFDDFRAMPTHVIFLSLIYPFVGLLLWSATIGLDLVPLLYPMASGFALVAPFAAIGLYELSRRRARGLDTSWRHAFDVRKSPSLGPILLLGLGLVVLFMVWIAVAHSLYIAAFGYHPSESLAVFARKIVSTREGLNLVVIGNVVGAVFALVAFAVSVISFPLLLDRDVGLAVAVTTSLKAVATNPLAMACWAAIITAVVVLGALPFLVGLAVAMPVLGHASWHLYKRMIEPVSPSSQR